MKSLIAKLDQPVGPDTQFRTIRLKYATAATVATSIQSFYANRTGNGQKVTAIADTRTNTIIIHGLPPDLDETAAFVTRLDAPGSASVDQAQIFRLRNSLAADVATTLQSAINAARGGAGTEGPQRPARNRRSSS